MESDITNVYELLAAVYRHALRDARSQNPRKREAAVEWLDVVAPDWREYIEPAEKCSEKWRKQGRKQVIFA